MKILALGDPHGVLPKNLKSIIKKNNIEAVICIGEIFPVKKNKNGIALGIDRISGEKISKKLGSFGLPTIIMKGNMFDSKEGEKYFRNFLIELRSKYKNFHYKKQGLLKIIGVDFIIFDMIYELHSHSQFKGLKIDSQGNEKRLKRLMDSLERHQDAILLSHAPPYGIVDKTTSGKHIGSKILLKAIKQTHPRLVLCGHIHEAKGKSKIGKTKIINLGCCGDYRILKV